MRASETRIKMFSTCDTSAMERNVNNWMLENPENEIHKIQLQVDKAVHVMVVYEPVGEVSNA